MQLMPGRYHTGLRDDLEKVQNLTASFVTSEPDEPGKLKTDVKLLLECLEYQKDNVSATKQALITISSILQSSAEVKDVFRDAGGLQKVLNLVTTAEDDEIIETGLYCLGSGVERNVFSQKLLTSASVFTFLHNILSSTNGPSIKKKQTATFLILCVVSNNGFGQNLARESSCLHDILALIRTTLPKNVKALQSHWCEGIGGTSLDLWAALVSAACACVNNPVNEENQRICASLIPYLFSQMSCQTNEIILNPMLSLVGLTVSSNVYNQDRVRKCGGLEIFLRKLEQLVNDSTTEAGSKSIAIHLLSTLDACITDSDENSKRFGQLGGVELILKMLAELNNLDNQDKAQAILTLGHAVDSCNENRHHVIDSGGMTTLIQLLTETLDEELSKTTKYLLHICVTTDKSVNDNEEKLQMSSLEHLLEKMETMKRYNDFQLLEKITNLENKLKSVEEKRGSKSVMPSQLESDQLVNITSLSERQCVERQAQPIITTYNGVVQSSEEKSYILQHDHSTTREKSLMAELTKEKCARQKLQKLYNILQENICMSTDTAAGMNMDINNSALCNKNHQATCIEIPQNADQHALYSVECQAISSACSAQEHQVNGLISKPEVVYNNNCLSEQEQVQLDDTVSVYKATRISSYSTDHVTHNLEREQCHHCKPATKSIEQNLVNTTGLPCRLHDNNVNKIDSIDTAENLNLIVKNHENSKLQEKVIAMCENASSKVMNFPNIVETVCRAGERKETIKLKENKNVEIQCGTPFILKQENQSKRNEHATTSIISTHADISCPPGPCVVKSYHTIQSCHSNTSVQNEPTLDRSLSSENIKSHTILQTDLEYNKKENAPLQKRLNDCKEETGKNCKNVKDEHLCINEKFVKPVALPPRSKVRITPRLGCKITEKFFQCNNLPSKEGYESEVQSEFDLSLMKRISIKTGKNYNLPKYIASPKITRKTRCVLKSLNNKIGKQFSCPKRNATDDWISHQATPQNKPSIPLRPIYSDIGMRRHLVDFPSGVMLRSQRRRSIDDSGIYISIGECDGDSSKEIQCLGLRTSPVDSNIDGFRSSSNLSDDEDQPCPNNVAVFRNNTARYSADKRCPGCTSSQDIGGPLLNSRTFNIAMETSVNTCILHRKLRQLERLHVAKIKKIRQQSFKAQIRLLQCSDAKAKENNFLSKNRSNKLVYNFTSESAAEISPLSENDKHMESHKLHRSKSRRHRIPYTKEEEENLIEGIQVLGKHWSQILLTYQFHPSRTNVDLREKYKRMMAAENQDVSSKDSTKTVSRNSKPFSMCEERRLRRGVMKYGYNWKTILQNFTFANDRTTDDLRNKWRSSYK